MKKIALNQNSFALVDDGDYNWLNQHKWCVSPGRYTFYAVRAIRMTKNKYIIEQMHRAILGLQLGDKVYTDHRDGDGLNNQRANLRVCTITQNNQHSRNGVNGSSKYKGVHWDRSDRKWYSKIRVNGRRLYLGRFQSETDAAEAYDVAALKHHKEFALTNKMLGLLK